MELAADLPMVEVDAVLFEQVLFNLLDNAAKYAPAGTTVRIQSWRDGRRGRPAGAGRRRGHSGRRSGAHLRQVLSGAEGRPVRAGTGLGLAISRGFVEAMHGTITAANRTDRTGAVFTIRLPMPAKAERLDTAA